MCYIRFRIIILLELYYILISRCCTFANEVPSLKQQHPLESGTMKSAENTWLESTTRLTSRTAQPIEGISMTIAATDTDGTALDFAPHFNDAEGNFLANPSWTAGGTMIGIPAGAASIYICLRRPDDSEIAPENLAEVILKEVK